MVGLLATGGSTNRTIHLVAMARAAGIVIDWNDFDRLSAVTLRGPVPNGSADVNHFHRAVGVAYVTWPVARGRAADEDDADRDGARAGSALRGR